VLFVVIFQSLGSVEAITGNFTGPEEEDGRSMKISKLDRIAGPAGGVIVLLVVVGMCACGMCSCITGRKANAEVKPSK